jgi:hypothetical protein
MGRQTTKGSQRRKEGLALRLHKHLWLRLEQRLKQLEDNLQTDAVKMMIYLMSSDVLKIRELAEKRKTRD